jgi:glycosyltransferase involved in cell wall biosynthesis
VCTGRPFRRHHGTLLEAVRRLKLEDQVKFLGPVPEEELVTVFERATMVVFPSLFEGLSQALLESLAFGKPILAARQTSIPETVGEAALLFDGLDVEAIVAALRRATTDADMMQSIASKAPAQLARFDWDRAALMLAACYKRAAGRTLTPPEESALSEATG